MTTTTAPTTTVPVVTTVGALRKALTAVKPAVPARSTGYTELPAVRIATLRASDSGTDWSVTATDRHLTLTYRWHTDAPGRASTVTVGYAEMAAALKGASGGTRVEIPPSADGVVLATVGPATVMLSAVSDDDYASMLPTFGIPEGACRIGPATVAAAVAAAGRDTDRPTCCNILVDQGTVVATDSYRLVAGAALVDGIGPDKALIPWQAFHAVAKAHKGKYVTVGTAGRYARITGGPVTAVVRTIEGYFPNYKPLIDDATAHNTIPVMLHRAAMLPLLRTLPGGKVPVRISASPTGGVSVSSVSHGPDAAPTVVADMPGRWDGAPEMGFTVRYLADLLTAAPADLVDLAVSYDPRKPVLMRTTPPEPLTCLLMPVRIND